MNKELLKMQKLAGIITEGQYKEKLNESEEKNKYFIVVNSKGQSDELGNFHGLEASNRNDFTQKFKDMFKDDISDYYTFHEVPNKQMMDKIVKLSDQWEGGEDTRETKMLQSIVDKAKKFAKLNLNSLKEIEGDPLEYSGYNEPYDHSVEADDPAGHDKVAFLADAFQYVWNMGKGNNTIDFDKMAKSTIEDLETRF